MKPHKIFILITLVLLHLTAKSQFSLFKDLNTTEAGSNPSGFFSINSIKIFVAEDDGKFHLWRTDGSESGTVKISELSVYSANNKENYYRKSYYQILNNELYFLEYNSSLQYETVWKTDGYAVTKVINNFGGRKLHWLNGSLIWMSHNSILKISNLTLTTIFTCPTGFTLSSKIPVVYNNRLYFFISKLISSNTETMITQIWNINYDGSINEMVKELPIAAYFDYWNGEYSTNQLLLDDHTIYYFRFEFDYINNTNSICLWKTDLLNGESSLVKKITYSGNDTSTNSLGNLKKFGNKLVFCSLKELWVSDGTEAGTILLKTFTKPQSTTRHPIELNIFPENFIITNDKLYFTANNGADDFELWASDGTITNTVLIKDINSQENSEVRSFQLINDKVYFLANESELWTTNGTDIGTTLVKTLPKLNNGIERDYIDAVAMPNNQICFNNYSLNHGSELWISDGNFTNENLLKNITTKNNSSFSNIGSSIKLGNYWYFNADDGIHGFELWKTDGTAEGTQMVKDIGLNAAGIKIGKMVKVNDVIFFVAIKTDSKKNFQYLYRTDGTPEGTFQIDLVREYHFFNDLTSNNDRLFFTHANTLYVCDKNSSNPTLLHQYYSPTNLISLENKILFTSGGELFSSDGTPENTNRVFPQNHPTAYPRAIICPIQFNNKVYFFANKNFTSNDKGFFETDGTIEGTKYIIDLIGINNFVSSPYFLFLEKTDEKMFFRLDHKINATDGTNFIDLWTSDGTTTGTKFLKKMMFSNYFGQNIKTQSIGKKIIISLQGNISDYNPGNFIVASDGTVENTNYVLNRAFKNIGINSFSNFNDKVYFAVDAKEEDSSEIYSTNGALSGTRSIGKIEPETLKPIVSTFVSFENKLLFFSNTENKGVELWQYLPKDCDLNQIESIKSGDWNDQNTWSCGSIPSDIDEVILNEGNTIKLPTNYNGVAKKIILNGNSNIEISNGAKLKIAN